ncbi:hypothetical protein N7528_009228 [Penicillium herquei]|nr:hypothetical protein N7528_009228 [Penicillium herquei]
MSVHSSRNCSVEQSEALPASTQSLSPQRGANSAKFTLERRYPAVSVVIPTRQHDELVARITKHPPAKARRRSRSSDGDSHDNDRENQISTSNLDESLMSGSKLKAKNRALQRPKRSKAKTLVPSDNGAGGKNSKSQTVQASGTASTLGESQEIFGRAVLRIQAHGPRHAYFMTFLPEVSHSSATPSQSEMPPGYSVRPEPSAQSTSAPSILRSKGHERDVTSACEDGARRSNKSQRHSPYRDRLMGSLSEDDKKLLDLKERQGLSWKKITEHFSGRSQGSLQVRYYTRLKQNS